MNLGQLRTHCINRAGGNDSISSVITEFINQICNDINIRHPWSWKLSPIVSVNATANQTYIDVSSLTNLGNIHACYELLTPRKLMSIFPWQIGVSDPDYFKDNPTRKAITPTHYYLDAPNKKLYLYPCPAQAVQIKLQYEYEPADLVNNNDLPLIPSKYHFVICSGVESLIWNLDEETQKGQVALQNYERGIQRMIDDENQLPDFQPIFNSPGQIIDYSDPFLEM